MAIDLRRVDMLGLIGGDVGLKRVAGTHGGEYAGPCPFCGGQDRFRVWPDHPDGRGRFWCRQCGARGDAVDYVRKRDNLGFAEAVAALGAGPVPSPTPARREPDHERLAPPPRPWQDRARAFLADCQAALWDGKHPEGLAWLRKRRLGDDTIRAAGLGLNVADRYEARTAWGLDPKDKPVWLPRGIVIPWEIAGEVWRVNIRRLGDLRPGSPKYIGPAGCANGLYGADALSADRPAMILEGEIDALTVRQVAGDLVAAAATGSTAWARRAAWIAKLALAPVVLVSFDADDAGEKAAAWWLGVLPNAKRWRPYWGDANGMAQDGADVRSWVALGLQPAPEPEGRCGLCGAGDLVAAYGSCGRGLCARCAARCEGLRRPSAGLRCAEVGECTITGG